MDSFRNASRTFTICERAAAVQAIALEEDPHAGGTDKKESSVADTEITLCSIACAFEQINE